MAHDGAALVLGCACHQPQALLGRGGIQQYSATRRALAEGVCLPGQENLPDTSKPTALCQFRIVDQLRMRLQKLQTNLVAWHKVPTKPLSQKALR